MASIAKHAVEVNIHGHLQNGMAEIAYPCGSQSIENQRLRRRLPKPIFQPTGVIFGLTKHIQTP